MKLVAVGLLAAVSLVFAVDPAEQYRAERAKAEATAKLMPAFPLAAADAEYRRAEQAKAAGRAAESARLIRSARWLLPAPLPGLPEHVSQILGSPRMRHGDWVSAVAFTPDGSRVITAGRDGRGRAWEIGNGQLVAETSGNSEWIRSIAVLSDRRVALAAARDILIWDIGEGKLAATLKGAAGPTRSIAFNPAKKWLLSSGEDRVVRVWDVDKAQEAFNLGVMSATVECVAWSADGELAAVTTGEGGLVVWNITARKKLVDLRVMTGGAALGVAFAPDGKSLAVCGERAARLIALPNPNDPADAAGAIRRSFEGAGGHNDLVNCLTFSSDGKWLATAGRDLSIRIWDVSTGQVARTLIGHQEAVEAIAFSPGGAMIASVGQDQIVRLWDLDPVKPLAVMTGHVGPVFAMAVAPDGRQVATGGADKALRLWEVATGKELASKKGIQGPVTALSWLADGHLVSASGDRIVRLWPAGDAPSASWNAVAATPLALAPSPDGQSIAVGGTDRRVAVFDRAGKELTPGPVHQAAVMAIAWRPDGQWLATGSADGVVKLWDVAGKKEVSSWRAHDTGGCSGLIFSIDGTRLFSAGGDRLVKAWKTPVAMGADPAFRLAGHAGPISALTMSRDGRLLATGGADKTVKVWDLASRSEAASFSGHADWVTTIAFAGTDLLTAADAAGRVYFWPLASGQSESGPVGHGRSVSALVAVPNALGSGAADRTAIVWDLASGRPRRLFSALPADVSAVGLSADGNTLVTSSIDRRLRVWNVETGKETRTFESADRIPMLTVSPDGKSAIAWHLREGGDDDVTTTVVRYPLEGGATEELFSEKGRASACLALSADSRLAAIGGQDGKLRVWSLAEKKRVGSDRQAAAGPIADVGIVPDNSQIVTADENGDLKVWPAAGGEPAVAIKTGISKLLGIAVDSGRVAVFGRAGDIAVFDLKGTAIRKWKLPGKFGAVCFTADGKRLAVGMGDGTILLLDLS
ncbi:MAG: WD40 repeat domain-containing protein [Gemmataceae bacterium]|nr:WD40 repeat domain-containing protein [Gemmataceae bacterium]